MSDAAAAKLRSELATRVGTGGVMIGVALLALALGGIAFWLLVAAAGAMMLIEWGGLFHIERWKLVVGLAGLALILLAGMAQMIGRPTAAILLTLAVAGVVTLVTRSPRLGGGLLYVGLPALALLAIRGVPIGFGLTLWTMAIVWATDIGGYFAGRRFGGVKLAPRISPAKTWSGLFGGMIAACAAGAMLGVMFDLAPATRWLGPVLAAVAQAGDLFESWLKRRAGVKDSGLLLPGHGGALDRLDGLVPVAPVAALLLAAGAL